MNYYQAKQRKSDNKWDYTRNNRPTGYCCEYKEIDPKVIPITEAQQKEYRDTSHKHHVNGHASEEEACECYKQYLLDHQLILNKKMSNQQLKCRVCDQWTQGFAEVHCSMFVLCPEHNNRKAVESLLSIGEACSSW